MQTNNNFSIKRFLLLYRQSIILNKKLIAISLIGGAGILFVALLLFQSMNRFQYWTNTSSMWFFLFCYVSLGGIYTSQSFPAFRSKEKSVSYLLLPVSDVEKFLFEFLTRIVFLILLFPPLFWIVANIEGIVIHHYIPELQNYGFSFTEGIKSIFRNSRVTGWDIFDLGQLFLFVYVVTFTGAAHFSKSPRIKTLFTLTIIAFGYFLMGYLLFKLLNIEMYEPSEHGILFIKTKDQVMTFFAIAGAIINLSLLAFAWFRFKEKEV